MSRPTALATTAVLVVATMLAAACSGGGSHRTPAARRPVATTSTTAVVVPVRSVTINPGGATVEVTMRPSTGIAPRVTFEPSSSAGAGADWQAAGWNAVTVATLLTGAPLGNREFDFVATGKLPGADAAASLTVAVAALLRGDRILPGAAPVGTIEPDGAIGPSGSPPSHATPGIEPTDVYAAYQRLTGLPLPALPAASGAGLDARTSARLQSRVATWLASYDASLDDFHDLAPTVQQGVSAYASAAARDERQAKRLAARGLEAGAFARAVDAAALMDASTRVGTLVPILLAQGAKPFVTLVEASVPVPKQITDLARSLERFTPRTVTEAGARLAAYSSAIDAESLLQLARARFAAKPSSDQVALAAVAQGAVYYDLAGSLATAARDLPAVAEGAGGARIAPIDEPGLTTLLRGAAEADLAALESRVVAPVARLTKASIAALEDALAAADNGFALARGGDAVLRSPPRMFGSGSARADAALGGAIALYARVSELVAKYSSFGRVNLLTLAVTGIAAPGAFDDALEHAHAQLDANIAWLTANRVSPVVAATDDDLAGVDRFGDAGVRFDALGDYWDGYVNSRVLAYLGGFAAR